MVKKFKNPDADCVVTSRIRQMSLVDYIQQQAADVLTPRQFMADSVPLTFWQTLFQPSRPDENVYFCHKQYRLCWPYADRLIYLAREFSCLEARSQAYIIKAASKGIWWRGDPILQFQHIVQAHIRYQRLDAEQQLGYRKQLMQAAKSVISQQ